jgi:hypothetical protein
MRIARVTRTCRVSSRRPFRALHEAYLRRRRGRRLQHPSPRLFGSSVSATGKATSKRPNLHAPLRSRCAMPRSAICPRPRDSLCRLRNGAPTERGKLVSEAFSRAGYAARGTDGAWRSTSPFALLPPYFRRISKCPTTAFALRARPASVAHYAQRERVRFAVAIGRSKLAYVLLRANRMQHCGRFFR